MSVWQLCFENATLSERRNNSQQHILFNSLIGGSRLCAVAKKNVWSYQFILTVSVSTHTYTNHASTTFSQRRRSGPEVSGEARKWWGIFKTNKQKGKKRLQIFAKKGETIAPFSYPHVSSKWCIVCTLALVLDMSEVLSRSIDQTLMYFLLWSSFYTPCCRSHFDQFSHLYIHIWNDPTVCWTNRLWDYSKCVCTNTVLFHLHYFWWYINDVLSKIHFIPIVNVAYDNKIFVVSLVFSVRI